MAKRVSWFNGFSGINNVVKTTRIGVAENGFVGLETASNVYVDAGGVIETVPDGLVKIDGIFHSLWGVENKFYCIKDESSDSTLYQGEVVNGELSLRTVMTDLLKGAKVSYTVFGNKVYYSNGTNNGYVDGVIRSAWPSQINTRLPNLVAFTPGTHLTSLAGRILSIKDDEVQFTESFLPGLYNRFKNRRRLNSSGRMVYSVGTGAYVSDEDCIYFLRGINPNEWKLEKVLEYPAIEYGCHAKLVDPGFFGLQSKQPAALFNTVNGICIGMATGEIHNLTDKRYRQSNDCNALSIFAESLILLSSVSDGLTVQGITEDVGNKSVTEWDGGFDSLFVTDSNEVIGANNSGLSLLWGQVDAITTGLEMLDDLEMLDTLEMI